jgi:hypothetical protein
MTDTISRDDIRAFAGAVRSHLDDLPADDVDELLDGLEADLSDQAAEAGDDFVLPDAAAYAAELRTAAGLPDRGPTAVRRPSLRARMDAADAAVARWISTHPVTAAVRDFLVALRPVWWILRAVVLALLTVPLLGIQVARRGDLLDNLLMLRHPSAWLLLAGLILLSVQWGRGRWVPTRWLRAVRTVVNVVTAVIAPFVLSAALLTVSSIMNASIIGQGDTSTPGLAVDGERVRNIFVYDENGDPIERAQLFDQNGEPLTTVGRSGSFEDWDSYFFGGGGPAPVAEREIGREPVWNVFPLRELPADAWINGEPEPERASAPPFPFSQVPALPVRDETRAESPSMSAGAEGAADPRVTPSPTEAPAP